MNEKNDKVIDIKRHREETLAAERRDILAMAPEKARDAILDHPYPVTLVQSMADEDLYLLVHTIGPDEALPVLGLASNEQWEYLLDMESWNRDRIDPFAMTRWLDRLLKADPDRFTHFIVRDRLEMLEYYLHRNIELYVREYENDPAETGEGFFSDDDVHYVRLRDYPDLGEQSKQQQEERDFFLKDLLRRISVFDYSLYQKLLLESAVVIPSEMEEEQFRLRNIRLAEKGFLPFDEAVGVYQPLRVDEFYEREQKPSLPAGRSVEGYPLPWKGERLPEDADLFSRTLYGIRDDIVLQRLQSEFAGLCNQIIAADQIKVREKDVLAKAVTKVSGYLSIGLEKIESEAQTPEPYRCANLIQSYLLADIFRVGYGCALELKWRAEQWNHGSWYLRSGLDPAFWGEAWLGVLGGLLIKKPLFFDNYATGMLYREFSSLADIRTTGAVLEQIIAFDDLLALMDINRLNVEAQTFLIYQNLILTLWANHQLEMHDDPGTPIPLSIEQFKTFFKTIWKAQAPPRAIKQSCREAFLNWLSQRCDLPALEISNRMGATLEQLFRLIESELGAVKVDKLDPRFIQLFLIEV